MKVYISVDLEGISGVVSRTFLGSEGHDYGRARKLMTEEVNAAINGALEAGATEIVVNDSHGTMTNILIELLHEKAQLISGTPKRLGMMEGIDDSFDAAILVGYHTRMNTTGTLNHSYHGGVISNVQVNKRDVGEFFLSACIAGFYGVPIVAVTGDNYLAEEVEAVNDTIERVVVKQSLGRFAAKNLSPTSSRQMISEKVKTALQKRDTILLTKLEGTVDMDVTMMNSGLAEIVSIMPGTKLIAPNKVSYKASSIIEAYQVFMVMILIANNLL